VRVVDGLGPQDVAFLVAHVVGGAEQEAEDDQDGVDPPGQLPEYVADAEGGQEQRGLGSGSEFQFHCILPFWWISHRCEYDFPCRWCPGGPR